MTKVDFICSKDDCSGKLESFINGLSDNTTVVLKGECYLSRKVRVGNKKGLTIVGEDAKIITAFDPIEGFYKYSGAFAFEACENLTIQNLIFDTDEPVNSAGKVTSVESDGSSFVVKMLDGCVLDGGQTIFAMNSMDKDGSPDYILASYEKSPYEVLENDDVRIFGSENLRKSIERLPVGERICFRFGLGNKDDAVFCISTSGNSKNCVICANVAKGLGLSVVALTGQKGGKLKEIADISIYVTETYKVQELHLPIYHYICMMLERKIIQ